MGGMLQEIGKERVQRVGGRQQKMRIMGGDFLSRNKNIGLVWSPSF